MLIIFGSHKPIAADTWYDNVLTLELDSRQLESRFVFFLLWPVALAHQVYPIHKYANRVPFHLHSVIILLTPPVKTNKIAHNHGQRKILRFDGMEAKKKTEEKEFRKNRHKSKRSLAWL